MIRRWLLVALFVVLGVSLARADGPGPTPSPFLPVAGGIAYNNGCMLLPATVTGGCQGVGTMNVAGLYLGGTPLTINTNVFSLLANPPNAAGGLLSYNTVPVTIGGTGKTSFTAGLPLLGNGTGALTQGTLSGNTTKFGTVSGALVSGHCLQADSNGNVVDAGGSCTTGGGGGTVSSGTAGNLAYYSTTGTVVTGLSNGTTSQVLTGGSTPAWASVNLSTMASGTLLAAQFPAIGGDCTTSAGSLTVTCTKTNGVAFGSLATLNNAPAGSLTGSTLNSTVTASSLTSVGTLGTLNVTGATGIGTVSPSSFTLLTVDYAHTTSPTFYWDTSAATFRNETPEAVGTGGGISLAGNSASSGFTEAQAAGLMARKTNSTPGDTTYGVDLWARSGAINFVQNGGISTTPSMSIAVGGNVGVGTSSPAAKLDVNGAIHSSGTVTASLFSGSGASLTGVPITTGVSGLGSGVSTALGYGAGAVNGVSLVPNGPGLKYSGPTGVQTNVPIYDVMAYGASPSNSASVNATAFQAAFTASGGSGVVHVPCGSYNLNAAPSVTVPAGKHFEFVGDGSDCAVINMQGPVAGPTINYSNQFSSARVANMTVTTDQIGTSNCLVIQGTFTNPNSAYAAASSFENLTFRGVDAYGADTTYCAVGLYDNSISNVSVINLSYQGIASQKGIGISLNGSGTGSTYAVQINVVNSSFNNCGTGIYYGDWVQGVAMANSNVTGCQYGANTVTSPVGTLAQLSVINSQMNTTVCSVCVNDTLFNSLLLNNNAFITNAGSTAVEVQGTNFNISENQFGAVTATGTTAIISGSTFGNGGSINNNVIEGYAVGVAVTASSQASLKINSQQFVNTTLHYQINSSAVGVNINDIQARNYSTLPTCNNAIKYSSFQIVDSPTATFNATVSAGGGVNYLGVKCDSSRYYVD